MRRGQRQQHGGEVEQQGHDQDERRHGLLIGRADERRKVCTGPRSASTAFRSPSIVALATCRSASALASLVRVAEGSARFLRCSVLPFLIALLISRPREFITF